MTDSDERLEIKLLGKVMVKLDGRLLTGFNSPRLQRLLAHLSSEGGVSRTRLAFDLWPDSTESQARGNLRKLLYDLRQVLPDAERFVYFGQQGLSWRPGADISVDLIEFRSALERGDTAKAVDYYGGELLPACYDDWVLAERDRLSTQALKAMLELASQSLAARRFDAAAEYAGRAVSIDNLSEPAYRLLIKAHAGRGDRSEGLRAYHRCAEVLQQQIGVEPQAATREAYEALLSGGPEAADTPGSQSLTPPSTPLIGRSFELASAMEVWRSAASGRAQLLLIEGEPGIGKTRLAEEAARLVNAEGFPVVRSRAYQAAGGPSWGPVIDWIRSQPVRSNLDRLTPEWLNEVARLLPELRAGTSAQPRSEPVNEIARRHLFEALTQALFGGNRPMLLVIDDLQWCDRETLEMIGFALRAAPAAPCLVLGTVRTEEIDDDHPLSTLRLNLARDGVLTEIPLGRLDAEATLKLAASVGGADLDQETSGQLWTETEGMPLFIVEAVRTGPRPAGGRTEITPTVRAVITARLAQLSTPARRLAEAAATVGRSFTVEVLATAEAIEEDQLVEAIDELWRRQIVREQWGAYDFSHDRIREVAYALIAPARRRKLHASVARALDGDPALASVVAAHYEQAGMVEDAVRALLVAGRRSVEVFALEDAVVALRRGLALLAELPGGRQREEMELALRTALGVPLVAREGYGSDSVQDIYQRAMILCQRLGRSVDPEVLRGLGLASLMSCRFDRAATFAEALLEHSGDPTAETEGHYLMGVNDFWRGDFENSVKHLQLAIQTYRPEFAAEHLTRYGQDPKAVCMVRLAITHLWLGNPEPARRLAVDALEFSLTLNHPTSEGYVRMYTGILAAELEDAGDLDRQVTAGEAIWSAQELAFFALVGRLLRGWHSVLIGAPNAVAGLREVVAEWRSQGQKVHFTYALALLARAELRSGDLEAARRTAEEGLRWTMEHDQRYLEPEFRRLLEFSRAGTPL